MQNEWVLDNVRRWVMSWMVTFPVKERYLKAPHRFAVFDVPSPEGSETLRFAPTPLIPKKQNPIFLLNCFKEIIIYI